MAEDMFHPVYNSVTFRDENVNQSLHQTKTKSTKVKNILYSLLFSQVIKRMDIFHF